ncbi:hypothetical protein GE21DRAFT_9087 [Neurospora crassa]|uniref:Uncharacterized protein n=1 Tax=Neurospora crassa (strain ATCC 24698 / 74-OR23-1A / CBS 708.71 / DSM 1257 / FGSC 987) TaxID=367110 RepID=Q7RXH7_NEUCR|nr:hypothetical protein NCU03873 [Neurospora crassa OR74A]EAA27310.1 hypothetical protein NCU03873 [Neurospora crassa OR74A]KHE80789.1 hypothetical protein GE21DRAFT_9087 [Neurospora crassa]|eukprot:XP_956546.1 hypothetical protein NCU03873 [Neurospora crassa OR74A]
MKAALLPFAAMLAVAAAQTTSVCAAAYIVETCLGTENSRLALCGRDDYGCKCAQYPNIIACYNNCPNDPRKASAMGDRDTWCALDKQYPSSTTKVAVATTSLNTAPAAAATTAATTAISSSGSDNENTGDAITTATGAASSNTASAPSTSATGNAAGEVLVSTGGLLAAFAGVVAAVL